MIRHMICIGTIILGVLNGQAIAEDLTIGDVAPPLALSRWVKGEPVKRMDSGRIYVVEFCSTFCAPCRDLAPHLSSLQDRYRDVVFLCVMIHEQDASLVGPFVHKMGDRIRYRVAIDEVPEGQSPDRGVMARTWMEAAGENTLATTFIIDKGGKIAWIGHAKDLDRPLAVVVSGSWRPKDEAKSRRERHSRDLEIKALKSESAALSSKADWRGAIALIDRAIAKTPNPDKDLISWRWYMIGQMKYEALNKGVADYMKRNERIAARSLIDRTIAEAPDYKKDLEGIKYWFLLEVGDKDAACDELETEVERDCSEGDVDDLCVIVQNNLETKRMSDLGERGRSIIVRAAFLANDLSGGQEPQILDLLARAYSTCGRFDEAVKYEEMAIALPGGDAPEYRRQLAMYRKEASRRPSENR